MLKHRVYKLKKIKKIVLCTALIISLFICFSISVCAYDTDNTQDIIDQLYEESGASGLMYKLPDNAKNIISDMQVESFAPQEFNEWGIGSVLNALSNILKANIYQPIKILFSIIAIILITAIFDALKDSSASASMDNILSIVSTLCIISVLSPSMLELIKELASAIENSCDFMILYIPVISVLIITGGHQISGGAFYGTMIWVSNAILQISSKVIIPLLKCILSLSIVASVSDKVSLSGFIALFKKSVKWILCFCMSLFVAFITMKSIVSVSEDTISNKVVKFAINNFVPLVGGALSDAYQTVVSCVGVLKSSVGVAAMIAIFAIFLPALIKCVIWQVVISFGSAVCEVFEIKRTCSLLNSLSVILSCTSAIILSIMVIYIISTAIIIIVGG